MRLSKLAVAGLGVAALVLATTSAGTASASNPGITAAHKATAAVGTPAQVLKKKGSCSSNTGTDSGVAISSQNFTDYGFASQSADDFSCKKSSTLKGLTFVGQYFGPIGTGPADSFNVTVYQDDSTASGGGGTIREPLPSAAVCSFTNQKYKSDGGLPATFTIKKLKGDTCKLDGSKKKAPTYWLEVQANMAFGGGQQWGWELASAVIANHPDFQDTTGSLGDTCLVYSDGTSTPANGNEESMSGCVGYDGSLMFTLKTA